MIPDEARNYYVQSERIDEAIEITSIVGVANTTLSGIVTVTTTKEHQLAIGNKIKIASMAGSAATYYNGTDL